MSLYRDVAIVLRSWKLGEADRIVSLHTRDHGKVRGVAKGVRRTRSKFGARLEPTSHIAIQLYRGRGELDTITQVETIDRFVKLRSDPARFARASALLEAVDQVSQDRQPDRVRHTMLTRALVTLDRQESPLVVSGFFFKLLAHEGVKPELDRCVSCGAIDGLEAIDFVEGGMLCRSCRRGRPISQPALVMLRRMLGGELGAVLVEPTSDFTLEVEALATQALESHLERRLRSVAVLDQEQAQEA